eukprot:2238430-Amphidinium_carterae.1
MIVRADLGESDVGHVTNLAYGAENYICEGEGFGDLNTGSGPRPSSWTTWKILKMRTSGTCALCPITLSTVAAYCFPHGVHRQERPRCGIARLCEGWAGRQTSRRFFCLGFCTEEMLAPTEHTMKTRLHADVDAHDSVAWSGARAYRKLMRDEDSNYDVFELSMPPTKCAFGCRETLCQSSFRQAYFIAVSCTPSQIWACQEHELTVESTMSLNTHRVIGPTSFKQDMLQMLPQSQHITGRLPVQQHSKQYLARRSDARLQELVRRYGSLYGAWRDLFGRDASKKARH